jgi:chemotaxis protein MotB
MPPEDEASGVPDWVVTFGDMMALLLTFFIMLVSMSEIKEQKKYQALVDSLRRKFGYETSQKSMVPGTAKPRNSALARMATLGRAHKLDIVRGGTKDQAPTGDHSRVRVIRMGDRSAVGSVIFFPEQGTTLDQGQQSELQRLAMTLTGKPQVIEVRGHTSLRPAADFTQFEDNWELAFRRARAAADHLVRDLGIDAQRIRISVAGASEPLYLGADPLKVRQNARVEVFLTDELADDRRGTEEERQRRLSDGVGKPEGSGEGQ